MKKLCLLFQLFLLASLSFAQPATGSVKPKLPKVIQPVFKKDSFNIRKYGAVADGLTLNTTAINKAIDACNKKGGGVVVVPPGLWLTGPVMLKSNVNLHLQRNAILQFTSDFDQYKLIRTNWEGRDTWRNESPLSATNATNIAITGYGIIDGNGQAWRMVKKGKLTDSDWKKLVASGGVLSDDKKTWYPSAKSLRGASIPNAASAIEGPMLDSIKDFLRPNLLVFTRCNKILLEGVTFQNSPAWCLHPLMSENLTVRGITVKNPWFAQNGDGIDLESCKNVVIENSVFDVGDDGLCIKSGRDEEGRKRAMPTENVLIRNCTVYAAHGGFVIGSEMSGGARNIYVHDCSFIGTDIGLRFKTTRGRGGLVENIYMERINMKDIVGEAILFDMYYAAQDPIALAGEKREPPKVQTLPVNETTPQFQNFTIKDVVCDGAEKAIFVRGVPEMHVKNILMENLVLQAKHAVDIQEASNITIKNLTLKTTDTDPLLYILNSDNITFNGLKYEKAGVLVNVQGDRTSAIKVMNTNLKNADKLVSAEHGADEKQVQVK